MRHCGLLWKVSVSALGVGRGFSFPERVQFTHGNDDLSKPTVQTNQNALANVDGGDSHSLWVGQAGCELPVKLLQVFGLARLTRHFHSKPTAAKSGQYPRGILSVLEDSSLAHQPR